MSSTSALVYMSRCESAANWRAVKGQPWLKLIFIIGFAIILEGGLWALFYEVFNFLGTLGGIGTMIITRLFSLFFFGMGTMMILSSIVTSYSSMFRAEEVPYLITGPIPTNQLVLYRATDAAFLSSWSFFFIVIPFLGAYATYQKLNPVFALWTVIFSIPFLFVCCGLGSLIALISIRWAPLGRILKAVLIAGVMGALVYGWYVTRDITSATNDIQVNLIRLIPGLTLASFPLFPSWWVSEGILALQNGAMFRGGMLWLCTVSSSLVMMTLVEGVGCLLFYPAWLRVTGSSTRVYRNAVLFPWLEGLLGVLPRDVRGLLAKDVRTFFRDPMQWSQTLIFFGLLALYFSNIRHFHISDYPLAFRNMLAFLNVFSVSAVMCSLSSRFVFPQLSLEGQGFWTIGLSPLTLRRVLLTKFGLALVCLESVSLGLMYLSCTMLDVNHDVRVVAMMLAASIALAFASLSAGMGAVFMDLNQRNPAAIVSGFGGTLNLILSLGFMLSIILPYAVLYHQHLLGGMSQHLFTILFRCVTAWLGILSVAVTVIPLHLGIRALDRREF